MNQQQLSAIWPGWQLVRKLGQGSYGGVYEIHRMLPGGRIEKAALKQIRIPHTQEEIDTLLAQSVSEERIRAHFYDQLQKLVREYSLMRELEDCPNIVACQDLSYQPSGCGWELYFRMELLTPLKQMLDSQYREMNVIRLGLEVCNALDACGSRNILHRDIKPENIMVSDKGIFKLGDFGIAKTFQGTQTGTMAGTYGYMAPEVANRQHYGASADIYSLGMVLYWLMNENTLPFLPLPPHIPTASQRQNALNRRFSGETLPSPKNGSGELKRIVAKACAFAPADRYHSVSEMGTALYKLYTWKQKETESILQELGLPASIMEEQLPESKAVPAEKRVIPETQEKEPGRKRPGVLLGGLCAMAAVAVGALLLLWKPAPEVSPQPSETARIQSVETAPVMPETLEAIPETTLPETLSTETEPAEVPRIANVVCTYEANETGVTITGVVDSLPGEAILPDTVDGLPVTQIGNNAFLASTTLKKIWLPDSVTEIGEKAFSGCTKLQNVQFPDSLIRIGASAFENCSSLSSLTLPEGLTTIESWAFLNCKRLTALVIPETVTTLGEWSFSGCSGLGDVQIHPGIQVLDNYVFFDCTRLTQITLPEGLKTIGIGTFSGCSQLSDVTLPDSLRTLSAAAFQGTALTSLRINANCSLGNGAVPLGCTINQY